MSCNATPFQTITHGKWILAGEHAVIRGHGALIFPLVDKTLTLTYRPNPSLELRYSAHMRDLDANTTHSLLKQILDYGFQRIHQPFSTLTGELHIESTIPVGVGMGASAALCVALTRWFASQQWIPTEQEFKIARELEHFFHGKSSGLDIMGVSNDTGLYFQNGQATPLQNSWSPKWQLSYCGQQGPTAQCIQTVEQLWLEAPHTGESIDQTMQAAVLAAKQALEQPFHSESQTQLAHAIQQACFCFKSWGLITPALDTHMQDHYAKGALAAKPTGSGGGGYVVSLWK
jgi:mevalonate kinase